MRHLPPATTTRILLIRHAATEANERRPYILQGSGLNGDLSEAGRTQAEMLGQFLASFPIRSVYASPLNRAVQTAEFVANAHGLMVVPVPELTECGVGKWEGLDWATIQNQHGDDYQQFVVDPANRPHPDGESYEDVRRRAQPAIAKIAALHAGDCVAVIAHNMVNRILLAPLLGLELKRAREIRQTNTGINVIEVRDGEPRLISLNGVFHLDHLPE